MTDYLSIKNEISKLIKQGKKICVAIKEDKQNGCKNLKFFITHYEPWYTKAYAVIKQLTPDRLEDFALLYSNPTRKELGIGTYCISDAMRTLTHRDLKYGPWTAELCVLRQIKMLSACLEKFDSKVFDIQTILQADIFDSEIESAKHLSKMGFLRAAGAICGVIIEKHFAVVSKSHNILIKKKSPTIADFNDAFKDNVYDTVEWRRIQRLVDIRNLCDHNKERDPTKDEVEELIAETEKVIKTIF